MQRTNETIKVKSKRNDSVAMKWKFFITSFVISMASLSAQEVNTISVFERNPINFGGVSSEDTDVIRLENGRIAIKKITLPIYKKGADVSLKMTLRSAGDRWDKSGSCFVITDPDLLSLIDINQSEKHYPEESTVGKDYEGIKLSEGFKPALEILRFMTPFGVGYYSEEDSTSKDHRRPVYIPKWEEEVVWETDISDLKGEVSGEAYIGIWIDTWTKEGYEVSLELSFDQRKRVTKKVLPLANTICYGRKQKLPDFFSEQDLEIQFTLDKPVKNAVLKYTTTGHGGHSGGDEFVKTKNKVFLNSSLFVFTPWRDDCASFRRYNPSSGVWLIGDSARYIDWEERAYKVKYIEERQASSDLSRSNWCPGSKVEPFEIKLNDLAAGDHNLRISIPAQPAKEEEFNHWLVSAYLVYEE
ncbi:MAG: hypothetical protein JXR03_20060 [Cyclobacteriaceae bacterium]